MIEGWFKCFKVGENIMNEEEENLRLFRHFFPVKDDNQDGARLVNK